MGIGQWQTGEAPREKLLERGVQALSDAELLAVMLRTGYKNCSALELARDLLEQFGGLGGFLRVDRDLMLACPGIGVAKYAQLRAALELARRQALQAARASDVLSSPDQTLRF